MDTSDCPREAETVRAAWGERPGADVDADLAAHLADCPRCAEIALLAQAFREDRAALGAAAPVPSAGLVWWRAQRRAREESARRAAGPIALVHAIAIGCAAAAAVALFSVALGSFDGWFSASTARWSWPALAGAAADAAAGLPYGAVLVLATSLILAPVALYLAFSER
jgi:hypothetical protein